MTKRTPITIMRTRHTRAGMITPTSTALMAMRVITAITVAVIATLAVGAKAWAGRLVRSRAGFGLLAMRGIEVGAAVVILAFGVLLLTGYVVSERMVGI